MSIRKTTISNLKENSIGCELCKGRNTLHVRECIDDVLKEAWFRCLDCKKDYGCKLHFSKKQDGSFTVNTEIIWTKEIKEIK